MLSDHGFTGIKTEVYLNRWLQENGYLNFSKDHPETIMDIGEGSKAFALDPSRIYINLKDKYPNGTVAEDDFQNLCKEIKQGIEDLVFEDGNRIAKKVFFKEELYSGPFLNRAPDLVVLSHHGYDLKGRVSSKKIFDLTGFQGMHTQDDAFMYSSNGQRANTIFELKDIILSDFS
jgi:predicted AlkP superfamily phosphohydrolase/phosphomutase